MTDEVLAEFNLVQIVNFNKWSRLVGTELRTSILDHIYAKDPTVLSNVKFHDPFSGDHVLILFTVNANKSNFNPVKHRDWRNYCSF